MHPSTRVESEEQVNNSRVSRYVGKLGGSANEYDADYLTSQPDSSKFFHLRLDELSDDRPQSPTATVPETSTPAESMVSLPSPTPPAFVSLTVSLSSLERPQLLSLLR